MQRSPATQILWFVVDSLSYRREARQEIEYSFCQAKPDFLYSLIGVDTILYCRDWI